LLWKDIRSLYFRFRLSECLAKPTLFDDAKYSQAYESGAGRPPPCLENLQGKRKLLKNPEYVPWMIKNIYSIQLIQGKLCFQVKRKLLNNLI